jgi:hypothetical protein
MRLRTLHRHLTICLWRLALIDLYGWGAVGFLGSGIAWLLATPRGPMTPSPMMTSFRTSTTFSVTWVMTTTQIVPPPLHRMCFRPLRWDLARFSYSSNWIILPILSCLDAVYSSTLLLCMTSLIYVIMIIVHLFFTWIKSSYDNFLIYFLHFIVSLYQKGSLSLQHILSSLFFIHLILKMFCIKTLRTFYGIYHAFSRWGAPTLPQFQ